MSRATHANRLINEASAYLLQHAHNPVDWYPWGDEAFDAARAQDKPIFLSVGYSTCYWCHVMERECFENEAIAAIMNEHFISIKVDREQRPDVDDVYMTAVQLLTHQGGWPMSVWLEPAGLRPFFAGTYFPPEDRYGRPGFPRVLQQIVQVWAERREAVLEQAASVAAAVTKAMAEQPAPMPLAAEHVEQAVDAVMRTYDAVHGGFGGGGGGSGGAGGGPKFPMPVNLDLLMATHWDTPRVRQAVVHTLDRMALGGMYDHIGGGFHRYSVDGQWQVPHFEKMLYDNAQLLSTYARAFELMRDPLHARLLQQTAEFVLREMTDEQGGYFSAQDAEVNHREGENYLWTAAQVRMAMNEADAAEFCDLALDVYGLNRGPNFSDPHHPEDGPKNVIHLIDHPRVLAEVHGFELDEFFTLLDRINAALLATRQRRDQPATDDTIITGWNGLMIAGLGHAGAALGEARYVQAATKAAQFILSTMRQPDGSLLRTWRRGRAGSEGFLEDYALFIHGLLALERTDDALELMDAARRRFWDEQRGAFFNTLADRPDLFVRTKGIYDGALPSGNSMMLLNLLQLRRHTGQHRFLDDAVAAMGCFSRTVIERPTGATLSVLALQRMFDEHPEAMQPLAKGDPGQDQPVVRVGVEPAVVDLSAQDEAIITVHLQITPGYHINAHQPGPDFLVPLNVNVVDDTSGIVLEPDYPSGERYDGDLAGDEPMHVHRGSLVLPVRIRKVGAVNNPRMTLTWQACTDRECLQPQTVLLPVTLHE